MRRPIDHLARAAAPAALLLACASGLLGTPAWAQTTAAAASAAATTALPGGVPRCRFAVPATWDARQARWSGDCRDGLAQGLGVLRLLQGNQVRQVFYGRLKDGRPVQGAIEVDGGWRAGSFDGQGAVVQDGERNSLIEAFDTASQAARQAAQRFQAGGNPASARLYRQKAEQLAKQMD